MQKTKINRKIKMFFFYLITNVLKIDFGEELKEEHVFSKLIQLLGRGLI